MKSGELKKRLWHISVLRKSQKKTITAKGDIRDPQAV